MPVPGPVLRVAAVSLSAAAVLAVPAAAGARSTHAAKKHEHAARKHEHAAKKHHAKRKHRVKKQHPAKRTPAATAPAATVTAPALAAGAIHVTADAIAAPGFHIKFDATRPAGAGPTTTGTFGPFLGEAVPGALLGVNTVAGYFAGPVQCLEANENQATLFYPIQQADPAALAGAGGVYIYLQDGGPGEPDHVSFTPVPMSSVSDCPVIPGNALMPTTSGDITIQVGR